MYSDENHELLASEGLEEEGESKKMPAADLPRALMHKVKIFLDGMTCTNIY